MSKTKDCVRCEEEFQFSELNTDGACINCAALVAREKLFKEFASSHGITRFLDPTGERYVYNADGSFAGKKGECVEFMDELWNALVRSVNREDLLI